MKFAPSAPSATLYNKVNFALSVYCEVVIFVQPEIVGSFQVVVLFGSVAIEANITSPDITPVGLLIVKVVGVVLLLVVELNPVVPDPL